MENVDPRKMLTKVFELIALYPPGEGYPTCTVYVGYSALHETMNQRTSGIKPLLGKEPIDNTYFISTNDQGKYIIRKETSESDIPMEINNAEDFLRHIGEAPITEIVLNSEDGIIELFSCINKECPEIKKWASKQILDATKSKLMGKRKKLITRNIIEELKYLPPGQFNSSFPGGEYYQEGAARWNSKFGNGVINYLKSLLK